LGSVGFSCLLFACILNTTFEKPRLEISKQETAINIQTTFLQALSAGHKRLITDLLWVQTLLESDMEHYKGKDLNNWLFIRFNTISVLDPKFYENYLYGGQFLNVVKDDLEGAKIMYEKGIKQFPEDYNLNFQAGFLYYFEAGEFKRGLELLSKVENHPKSPRYLSSIINKLRLEVTGDLEAVFSLVFLNWQATKDSYLKDRIKLELYAIRAEIDLKCLNSNGSNCRRLDLDGVPYPYSNGKFNAAKEFRPFRIKTKVDLKNKESQ
jgi:tetratricopeptide (TPR) repeat protein